jgi:hypothetical protein
MTNYVKYTLEDGSEILVQLSTIQSGVVRAGLQDKIDEARKSFDEALDNVRLSALQIRRKFHDLQADEVEVKFGLTATGDFGNNVFAVCKVGVEANYEVTLKWSKTSSKELDERIRDIQLRKDSREARREMDK